MIDFSLLRWEASVTGLALVLLLADLFLPFVSKRKLAQLAGIFLGIFLFWSFFIGSGLKDPSASVQTAHGFYVLDQLAVWSKQFAMLATILTIFMSIRFMKEGDEHYTEYILLQLFACLGMMLVGSVANLMSMFVFLELMTVAFYVLVSYRRNNLFSLEAGLKYLIYGAFASGILLYGITLVYGATGEVEFSRIAAPISPQSDILLISFGMILILVGIAFKISAAPFHWWTPDVYEGAPTPTATLLSIGSKGAGFILLIRVLGQAFPRYYSIWEPVICVFAGASILVGNLGAMSQGNLKRLMGYSSISHSGYLLLGIAAFSINGFASVLYYLVGYLLANALVFFVACETQESNPRQDIRAYSGFGTPFGLLPAGMTLGLLSLSGIPPLAGFFGKMLLFRSLLEMGTKTFYILLGIGVVGAISSLYYYLGILRVMYFSDAVEGVVHPRVDRTTCWILILLMIAIVITGFYPSPWLETSFKTILSLQ